MICAGPIPIESSSTKINVYSIIFKAFGPNIKIPNKCPPQPPPFGPKMGGLRVAFSLDPQVGKYIPVTSQIFFVGNKLCWDLAP